MNALQRVAGHRLMVYRIGKLAQHLRCSMQEADAITERLWIETRHSGGSIPYDHLGELEARLGSRWEPGVLLAAMIAVGLVAVDGEATLRGPLPFPPE